MKYPSPLRRLARSLPVYVLLAINVACAPVVAMAAEAHEALHAAHGEGHGSATVHGHTVSDHAAGVPDATDGHGPLDESLHSIAHLGHCCGLLSAITASSPEVPAIAASNTQGADYADSRAQQIPAPLLRPPKR